MIPSGIPDKQISKFAEFVNIHLGLHFPKKRWGSLRRGIVAATREFAAEYGIEDDTATCIEWLMASPFTSDRLSILADHLTIGETYFFRDNSLFEIIGDGILPELIGKRRENGRKLVFWSAGCCTGEEPFSLAMMIDYMLPDKSGWDIRILASDISSRFLKKAKEGFFTNWSFRETPQWIIDNYFIRNRNGFEISPRIREMITFDQINLATETVSACFETKIDMILCRNVLMYFDPELRNKAIRQITESLADCGWLAVSPSEAHFVKNPNLKSVRFSEMMLYRKGKHEFEKKAGPIRASEWKRILSAGKPADKAEGPTWDLFSAAQSAYAKGNCKEASKMLLKLLDATFLGPGNGFPAESDIMALLAKAMMKLGKPEDAAKWYELAAKSGKPSAENHYLLSTVYRELGCFDKAFESLKRALETDPEFALAHFALGHLAKLEGRPDESAAYLERALDLLTAMAPERILPHGDGIPAGTLVGIVRSMLDR